MLSRPVTTATAAAAAATLLACAFRRTIAGLALFHGGQRLLLPRWPLRLLLAILRLALALFLIAVASRVARVVRILARAPARHVAFVALGAPFRTAVPMFAARRFAPSLRVARPGFHRFSLGLRLAGQPTEYFL